MTDTKHIPLVRSIEASIVGFHNPRKHKGLTEYTYLELYCFRLQTSSKPLHKTYLTYLRAHELHFRTFIRKTLLRRKRVL